MTAYTGQLVSTGCATTAPSGSFGYAANSTATALEHSSSCRCGCMLCCRGFRRAALLAGMLLCAYQTCVAVRALDRSWLANVIFPRAATVRPCRSALPVVSHSLSWCTRGISLSNV